MKIVDAVQTGVLRQVLQLIDEAASREELAAREGAYQFFSGGEKNQDLARQARTAVSRREALVALKLKVQSVRHTGEIPGLKP